MALMNGQPQGFEPPMAFVFTQPTFNTVNECKSYARKNSTQILVKLYSELSPDQKIKFNKNKYVLIGASAQGLFDLVKTPLVVTILGVEVHANVIENILDQSYLVRNPNTYIFELIFSIV